MIKPIKIAQLLLFQSLLCFDNHHKRHLMAQICDRVRFLAKSTKFQFSVVWFGFRNIYSLIGYFIFVNLEDCDHIRVEIGYFRFAIMPIYFETSATYKPPKSCFIFDEITNHLTEINSSVLFYKLNNPRDQFTSFIAHFTCLTCYNGAREFFFGICSVLI